MQLSGSFNHDDLETVDLIHRESTEGKRKKKQRKKINNTKEKQN